MRGYARALSTRECAWAPRCLMIFSTLLFRLSSFSSFFSTFTSFSYFFTYFICVNVHEHGVILRFFLSSTFSSFSSSFTSHSSSSSLSSSISSSTFTSSACYSLYPTLFYCHKTAGISSSCIVTRLPCNQILIARQAISVRPTLCFLIRDRGEGIAVERMWNLYVNWIVRGHF